MAELNEFDERLDELSGLTLVNVSDQIALVHAQIAAATLHLIEQLTERMTSLQYDVETLASERDKAFEKLCADVQKIKENTTPD